MEKEAFAVLVSMERLRYLTLPSEVQIHTDHRNLLALFNPRPHIPTIASHVAFKLHRWGIKLSAFAYRIGHVDGESNFMADLMTRWARGKVLRVVYVPPPVTPDPEELLRNWMDDLRSQQKLLSPEDLASLTWSEGLYWAATPKGIYVPTTLRLRLLIASHCWGAGHRNFAATLANLQDGRGYSWPSLLDDVRTFVNGCLHCRSSDGPYRIPRPWAEALHATRPNEILHMDWLYIGVSLAGHLYILIVKDDLSSYVWLRPFIHADAASTVALLRDWMAAFGVCRMLISDQGSHFMNSVMQALARELRLSHHFTIAYSPWANGTVEVVNREVLRVLRKLSSELQLGHRQWATLVPIVQGLLNATRSPKLGGRTPLQVFTGHSMTNELAWLSSPPTQLTLTASKLDTMRSEMLDTLPTLEGMHNTVVVSASKQRQQRIRVHNAKTHVAEAKFDGRLRACWHFTHKAPEVNCQVDRALSRGRAREPPSA